MQDIERRQRAAVIAEARSWLRTPYHHAARLKGVGVDCAQILIGVFSAPSVALIPPIIVANYSPQWHLNRSTQRYLAIVEEHAKRELGADETPLPGDVVLWQFARCFSHGAIVIAWPRVIHAYVGRNVCEEDAEAAHYLARIGEGNKPRPRRAFSFWG